MPVTWTSNEHHAAAKARTRVKASTFFHSLNTEERHYFTEALRNACHSAPAVESNLFGLLHDLGLPREPREKLAGEA